MGRTLCARCARPTTVCVCAALPAGGPISLRTRVMVLQHPLEGRKVRYMHVLMPADTHYI